MYNALFQTIRDYYGSDGFIPLHEPRFTELDKSYVADAIDSTFVSSVGAYVDRFEQELADLTGAARAVAVVNGTSALQVALRLVGVERGDEVLTQSLTFVATANAIVYNGASPVFIDVDRSTMGLSPDAVQQFLETYAEHGENGIINRMTGRRIAAIVPMHTFGHPCRISELCDVAKTWGIPLVEDAAEAVGSYYESRHCGTFGDIGVFSFNGNKTITCGGGGAIVSDDIVLAERAKHLTTTAKVAHPWEFIHDEVGYNFRMPNLNAALGCAQLEQLPGWLKDKRELAEIYAGHIDHVEWAAFVREPEGCRSNYWLNALLLAEPTQRDRFLEVSNEKGIMVRPAWRLLSRLEMFADCQQDGQENSAWLEERLVNIPSSARAADMSSGSV